MPIRKQSGNNPAHIYIGTTPLQKIYKRNTLLWSNLNPPRITQFSVSPERIDLDTRATGVINFNVAITGRPGQTTTAYIILLFGGGIVSPTYLGGSGLNINETPSISQPSKTTDYRLIARNSGGTVHRDTRVIVTQNPVISNLRRLSFIAVGSTSGDFRFGARIKGTPQPVITWRFGNGQQSQRANDNVRFSPVAGQTNTWDIVVGGSTGILHTQLNDSFTLTATNSSAGVSSRISSISA